MHLHQNGRNVLRRKNNAKDIKYNDQQKKEKKTKNSWRNTTQKTKGRTIRTPLKTELYTSALEGFSVPATLDKPCFSCYKPDEKSWIRKERDCDFDKLKISVVICVANICMSG
jgi:hypothetical protein